MKTYYNKPMNRRKLILASLIVCLLLVLPFIQNKSLAQSTDSEYFPQTGHTVSGDFLEKYYSVPNPTELFGYPITEAIAAPASSPFSRVMVQYFQRAAFEYHPENAPGLQVQLVPLGAMIFEKAQLTAVQALPANQPACQSIGTGGHHVCYTFLTFFNQNGGIENFGSPLTDMVKENERIVQYFEYARFEWRPEMAQGRRVLLSKLGEIYFNANEIRQDWFIPDPIEGMEPLNLLVSAFPLHAVISESNAQIIYVIVKDQINVGVEGAQVILTIITPDGQNLTLVMPSTDANGMTSVQFAPVSQTSGRVEVLVKVDYPGLSKTTRTSYRIW